MSEAKVLGRIQVIAEGVGAELDCGWTGCWREVAARWGLHLEPYERTLPGDVAGCFDDMLRDKLRQAIQAALAAGEVPSADETAAALGRTAILLLRLVRLPALAIPVFLLEALRPLASFIVSRINSPEEVQAAVSERLGVLGNQVGSGVRVGGEGPHRRFARLAARDPGGRPGHGSTISGRDREKLLRHTARSRRTA